MTVKELQEQLSQFEENTVVRILDSEWGYIDITDIFHSDHSKTICIS